MSKNDHSRRSASILSTASIAMGQGHTSPDIGPGEHYHECPATTGGLKLSLFVNSMVFYLTKTYNWF